MFAVGCFGHRHEKSLPRRRPDCLLLLSVLLAHRSTRSQPLREEEPAKVEELAARVHDAEDSRGGRAEVQSGGWIGRQIGWHVGRRAEVSIGYTRKVFKQTEWENAMRANRLWTIVLILAGLFGLSAGAGILPIAILQAQSPLTPAQSRWTIRLTGIPDSAGKGAYACQGCDGYFTGADGFAAAGRPLAAVPVRIYRLADYNFWLLSMYLEEDSPDHWVPDPGTATAGPSHTPTPTSTPTPQGNPTPRSGPVPIWEGELLRGAGSQFIHQVAELDVPPPYVVHLARQPAGYAVCPNTPYLTMVDQDRFDAAGASRKGAGRYLELKWSFWSCPGTPLGQDLPLFRTGQWIP